jgi:hypothetical protein
MTPIPAPLLTAAGRSAALRQSVSLPAVDIAAGLEAALEVVAEDITEKKHLTWRSIELYQGLRKDSTNSSAWEIALDCVKDDGGWKPGNTHGRKVLP